MRILCVARGTPWEAGAGGEFRHAYHLAEAIAARGHTVDLALPCARRDRRPIPFAGRVIWTSVRRRALVPIALYMAVRKVLDDYDIVRAHGGEGALIGRRRVRGGGRSSFRYVCSIHYPAKRKGIWGRYQACALRTADLVSVPSEFVKRHTAATFGVPEARLRVSPGGVSDLFLASSGGAAPGGEAVPGGGPQNFAELLQSEGAPPDRIPATLKNSRSREPGAGAARELGAGAAGEPGTGAAGEPGEAAGPGGEVLYVGVITRRKGIDTLLRAMPLVRRARPRARLTVVGPKAGSWRGERLSGLMAELALGADAVRVLGEVPQAELPALYAACDVYCLPATDESFALALIEAQACGAAVVGTRSGGTPEAIRDGETGVLVPPRDPPALAAAIVALLSDPAARRRLGTGAAATVRARFTWAAAAERTERIYAEALAAPAPAEA